MMSLTAVNTVSMETPTTALAYISGSSLTLHSPNQLLSLSLSLSLPPPSPLTTRLMGRRDSDTRVEGGPLRGS
ncbi:hypothetical protein KUCAC02_012260 [Chaenocephalus aceratus]|uniref:Uncharacterized protein n=1 Tax=Chaenocephalus aceratus TaxID=36190 RepID=A0ACB9XA23_CHAAC|nr:hypothetical protein KUCAC02_012260 [Chaenocephalus aceratus]